MNRPYWRSLVVATLFCSVAILTSFGQNSDKATDQSTKTIVPLGQGDWRIENHCDASGGGESSAAARDTDS